MNEYNETTIKIAKVTISFSLFIFNVSASELLSKYTCNKMKEIALGKPT